MTGIDLGQPAPLFAATVVLSNLVSNVPASTHPSSGAILALASALAGNLIVVGSIANIIVVEQARLAGVHLSWREHARVGVPVTLASLIVAGAWIAIRF